MVLTYYVAYYLPAALVGKIAGWTAANVVLFAWSATGAALAFLWLVVLSGAPVWRCLADIRALLRPRPGGGRDLV